jgi:hypothetical protein
VGSLQRIRIELRADQRLWLQQLEPVHGSVGGRRLHAALSSESVQLVGMRHGSLGAHGRRSERFGFASGRHVEPGCLGHPGRWQHADQQHWDMD